jgi:hypothetical protein
MLALLLAGRGEEAIARAGDDGDLRLIACMDLGRVAEARVLANQGRPAFAGWVAAAEAVTACLRGDAAPGIALLAAPRKPSGTLEEARLAGVILPAALAAQGHPEVYQPALAALRATRWASDQHPWHDAGFLLGEIDEAAYLAQPHHLYAPADLLLLRGIRQDRAGAQAAAAADYRAWLALPWWRRGPQPEATEEGYVRWRLDALAAAP